MYIHLVILLTGTVGFLAGQETTVGTEIQEPARVFGIGAILSEEKYGHIFEGYIEEANRELPPQFRFNGTWLLMDDNPIRASEAICSNLIPQGVYVVIASHPPHSDLSPMAVSFTCGFYKIPVIGIAARNSAFSDKVIS